MWALYHSTRVSAEFGQLKLMVSVRCATSISDSPETETNSSLTYEECNVLRYIAGYVCAKTGKVIHTLIP